MFWIKSTILLLTYLFYLFCIFFFFILNFFHIKWLLLLCFLPLLAHRIRLTLLLTVTLIYYCLRGECFSCVGRAKACDSAPSTTPIHNTFSWIFIPPYFNFVILFYPVHVPVSNNSNIWTTSEPVLCFPTFGPINLCVALAFCCCASSSSFLVGCSGAPIRGMGCQAPPSGLWTSVSVSVSVQYLPRTRSHWKLA